MAYRFFSISLILFCLSIQPASAFSQTEIKSLTALSLYQSFEPKIELPKWDDTSFNEVVAVFNDIHPLQRSQAIRQIYRQILTDSMTGIDVRNKQDLVTLFDARFQALNRYGFFHETLSLYTKILATIKTTPPSWARAAVYAFIMTGQIDAGCLELSFIEEKTNDPLEHLCQARQNNQLIKIDTPQTLETAADISHFILMLWSEKEPQAWLRKSKIKHTPLAEAALSYQGNLPLARRYQALNKGLKYGVIASRHVEKIYDEYARHITQSQAKKWAETPSLAKKQSLPSLYNAVALVHDKKKKAALIYAALEKVVFHQSAYASAWIKINEQIADQSAHFKGDHLETIFALLLMHGATEKIGIYNKALMAQKPEAPALILAKLTLGQETLAEESWQKIRQGVETSFPKTAKKRLKNILNILGLYGHTILKDLKDEFSLTFPKKTENVSNTPTGVIKLLNELSKKHDKVFYIAPEALETLRKMHSVKFFAIFDKITLEMLTQSVL